MSINEKLTVSDQHLEIAKRLYSSGTKKECKTIYNDIITCLKLKKDAYSEFDNETKKKFVDVKGRAMMNLSLFFIKEAEESEKDNKKQKILQKVLDMCNELLLYDENSIKGLYRRGTVFFMKKMYENSKSDFVALLKIDPNNKPTQEYLKKILQATKKTVEKEKKICKGIFTSNKWAEETAREEKVLESHKQQEKLEEDLQKQKKLQENLEKQVKYEEYLRVFESLEKGVIVDTTDIIDPITDLLIEDDV